MLFDKPLIQIPGFWAELKTGEKIPFIVIVKFFDQNGRPVLSPIVKNSINTVSDITGRSGILTLDVDSNVSNPYLMGRFESAKEFRDGIVLIQCATGENAEAVMTLFNQQYRLTLMKYPEQNQPDTPITIH